MESKILRNNLLLDIKNIAVIYKLFTVGYLPSNVAVDNSLVEVKIPCKLPGLDP